MTYDLLDPKNDFVFKRIFGSEKNTEILLAFLNRILHKDVEEPMLTEIVLLNPYTDKDSPSDKQSIFDIKAKRADGSIVNVEMQLFNRYDNEKRALYYWGKQYTEQLKEGEPYKRLKKCVVINILDFTIIQNERYHNVFRLWEDSERILFSEDEEIHILELSKLIGKSAPKTSGLLNWLLFLKTKNKRYWEVLKMNEPILGKAMKELEYLSQDEEARRLYEMRQKALHDEASSIAGAKEEGKKEGKLEEKEKVAKILLQENMDVPLIMKATGLTEDVILQLKSNIFSLKRKNESS
ncbi:Rpn family recombination-promoting nuclease/putative transposase [Shimazuella alba]|uniref:Rpn family recombination-promoting nuclease/putative transposase n=1 Tax=Shimazuella alba TaxID=2690964 RepID=A0A6I4VU53_9BACL|nr:Rpn family recombination-promoting nuclease/putative transposase [Shimazuella alba]